MSKGSADRGSPEKRRQSGLWCSVCGNMRGASCTCKADTGAVHTWGELQTHPIGKQLLKACGHSLTEPLKREKEQEQI